MTESNEAQPAVRPLRVVHQSERQRQHARYRIAASVRIGEQEYRAEDWSIGGVAIADPPETLAVGNAIALSMLFPFEGMQVEIELDAQTVWCDPEAGRAALRFVGLNERQLASLRYVIDAYLSGEILSTGDLIRVAGREPSAPAEPEATPAPDPDAERRRTFRIAALGLGLFVLCWFVLSSLYLRLFTVEAVWAAVQAPVLVMRAPQASFFEPTELLRDGAVERGKTVALAELVGGGAVALDSPCDCSVIEVHALSGEFVAQGEPLVTLLPEGGATFVNAQLAWPDLERVRRGDRAELELADGQVVEGTVQALRAAAVPDPRRAAVARAAGSAAEALAEVTVVPDEPIQIERLDEPVWVRIHTGRS